VYFYTYLIYPTRSVPSLHTIPEECHVDVPQVAKKN
jgi:hypothetical protein